LARGRLREMSDYAANWSCNIIYSSNKINIMEKEEKLPETAAKPREEEEDEPQEENVSERSQESETEFAEANRLLEMRRFNYFNLKPLIYEEKYNKRYLI
jgi:hypothetical protein